MTSIPYTVPEKLHAYIGFPSAFRVGKDRGRVQEKEGVYGEWGFFM
jgi:hypothetical protein